MDTAAFVFPGQGSQGDDMGPHLMPDDPTYARLLADANRLSGMDVSRPLAVPQQNRPGDRAAELTVTTQLSVFALSVALGRALLAADVRPRVLAGHSLGEYSALVVGGWLDVDDGLELVAARAAAMAACCSQQDGAMIAVVGLAPEAVQPLLAGSDVYLANVNSPKQCVLSGHRRAVAEVVERARSLGATATIPLRVAGAFHSPLMAEAQAALAGRVATVPLQHGHIPLISGITGRAVTDLGAYRQALTGQITAPVRWLDVMTEIGKRVDAAQQRIVEVGPGSVLRGLFRQLDRRRQVVSCGCWADCLPLLPTADADRLSLSA